MTVRAADLRVGDQVALVWLTVASITQIEDQVLIHFADNDRVEVLGQADLVHILPR